jgi:hypothetical protein
MNSKNRWRLRGSMSSAAAPRPAPPTRPLHYMLRYNIENLSQDHLATIIGVLDGDADGQQIAAAWIAKEHLRDLLALRATRAHVTPAPSTVRDKLASFYLCAQTTTTSPR